MLYTSETLGDLAEALSQAQGAYKKLLPNEHTATSEYANLQAILDAVQPALKDNGLAFIQLTELKDDGHGAGLLWTWLSHKSGEYMKSAARLRDGGTDRSNDTRNQTLRRIQASLLLGIAPSKNDYGMIDDDGISHTDEVALDRLKKINVGDTPKAIKHEVISKAQYDDIMIELTGYKDVAREIQEFYHIETIAELPINEYHATLQKIRKIKNTYKNYMDSRK